MKNIVKLLGVLSSEDLLGAVGETILANPDEFETTLENMADYYEGQSYDKVLEHLATSSLAGGDDELAIQEWVAEEDREILLELLD
jgi:hypothetical protein